MSQMLSSVTFHFSREDKTATSDDQDKLLSDECQEGKPNNAIKDGIRNGILEKAMSQTGPWNIDRLLPRREKAISGIRCKAGQWERKLAKRSCLVCLCASESLGRLVETGSSPPPVCVTQQVCGQVQESAFLTSFWVMLMQLVQRPHSDAGLA